MFMPNSLSRRKSYVKKYQNISYFHTLISEALEHVELSRGRQMRILDLGSGAGNSILPLLELFPGALIIATDLSVELLSILKQTLKDRHQEHACALLQLNAEELDFKPESFDIVLGAAILHHLFAPERTIEGCVRILKKGGCAIFFEPFESGNMMLRMAYDDILRDPRSAKLAPEVSRSLRAMIRGSDERKGRDKSATFYRDIDDKWLFTRSYFRDLGARYDFTQCIIYPLHGTLHQFEEQTKVNLGLMLGTSSVVMPEWAWEVIRRYDNAFSDDVKEELLIEGCVILQKARPSLAKSKDSFRFFPSTSEDLRFNREHFLCALSNLQRKVNELNEEIKLREELNEQFREKIKHLESSYALRLARMVPFGAHIRKLIPSRKADET
jgi:ubiquinone/menaquinone biosynthesis C-methylase UbiE